MENFIFCAVISDKSIIQTVKNKFKNIRNGHKDTNFILSLKQAKIRKPLKNFRKSVT